MRAWINDFVRSLVPWLGLHWNDKAEHEGVTFTGLSITGRGRRKFVGFAILED